ncbi:MAG TPA: hypothetical protein VLE69_00770 [Candidatus Saccharimonadales bacterium]|nr:hypothetical protein [Candidatus Saccharimonadales bacterium]
MASNPELTCVISGSFKFKPEIDADMDELREYNIRVLSPGKGWLYTPKLAVVKNIGIRPLPDERWMEVDEIEPSFLYHMDNSHFVYLHNQEGYVGEMVGFEMGWAMRGGKPIYAKETLNYDAMQWDNPFTFPALEKYVKVMPIPDIRDDYLSTQTP